MNSKENAVEKRCSKCSSVVGKGRTHKCTKAKMQENLHKIVKQKSFRSKQQIGGKIIKSIFDDEGVSKQGGTVMLATGGKKLPVSLSMKFNKVKFTHKDLKHLQGIHGNSDQAIKKTTQEIRHVLGRTSVEPEFPG